DLRAVIGRPADAFRDVRHRSPALGREDLHRHQLRAVREARDADAVVRRLRDRTGDVRAVALIVGRDIVLRDEVVTGDALGALEVGALREAVRVVASDARIDDGDRDALTARVLPGLRPARARHVPLLGELRIV